MLALAAGAFFTGRFFKRSGLKVSGRAVAVGLNLPAENPGKIEGLNAQKVRKQASGNETLEEGLDLPAESHGKIEEINAQKVRKQASGNETLEEGLNNATWSAQ